MNLIAVFLLGLFLSGCAVESKDLPVEVYHQKNFLYNSNFDHWQRGTQFTVQNGEEVYGADRWYVKNSMGAASAYFGRVDAKAPGSRYGASVSILTIADPSVKTGLELYQTVDNATTLSLVGDELTFSIRVTSLGRTKRVGVQFLYNRVEKMVDRPLDLEKIYQVRPDSSTLVEISAPSLKYIIPSEGVLGVRVRLVDAPAVGDGFVVEQAMLNPGITAAPYTSRYNSFESEEAACQRFFQKSFSRDQYPPPLVKEGEPYKFADDAPKTTIPLISKRAIPQVRLYEIIRPLPRKIVHDDGKTREVEVVVENDNNSQLDGSITEHSFVVRQKKVGPVNWTADAEITSADPNARRTERNPRTLYPASGPGRLNVIE